jgi:tRNA (Uracil-5-)-methyltransferase
MPFRPTDFTQVNPYINRVLVARALTLLAVQKNERVIDWFCGLGNFTLPLATQAREVLGVEGAESLVARSRDNYKLNQSARAPAQALALTRFAARNLFEIDSAGLLADGLADKWRLCLGTVFGRAHAARVRYRRMETPASHCLRQLQPRHPGARRCCVVERGWLPLHGGGGSQYVCPYRAR